MGNKLHGNARTTEAVRREIQESDEGATALARKKGVSRPTIYRWRGRESTEDVKPGPRNPRSTALTEAQEALCVLYRRWTRLPLDDCLYWLQREIPHLSRSTLHRCFQDHGISRLWELKGGRPGKKKTKKFKDYPIGYFHIDICEVGTGEGRQQLFVAIDRTCKYVYAEVHDKKTKSVAAEFLRNLVSVVPYRIHTILTDNGVQFTNRRRDRQTAAVHEFEKLCVEQGMEHRLTKVYHPWTNGQVERMNRTIKEATVKRFYYDTHEQFREHLGTFIKAYNFAKRLRALRGRTPIEEIRKWWRKEPERFMVESVMNTVALNS